METKTTLKDLYSFPGFRALVRLKPRAEDPDARVIALRRRQKKAFVPVAVISKKVFMTGECIASEMSQAAARGCMLNSNTAGFFAKGARP